MNNVIISGRLTKNIEMKQAQSGMMVGRFTLALDRGKDKEGNSRGADFVPCVAFGKTAEAIDKWTEKGGRLMVAGHIQTGSYEKDDGQRVYTTDVIVDRMEIIDFKDNGSQKPPQKQTAPKEDTYTGFDEIEDDDDDDGIPF